MFISKFKLSFYLSIIIIILAIVVSAGGLFIGDLYQDNDFTKLAWFGNDLVTLFVAVPMMIISLLFSIRNSDKAKLIWMGSLWYMVYNYIFYLYGSAFNRFFLLYVALFTLSTYALIFALIKVDSKEISKKFNSKTPIKWISGYMIFFALLLGILWTVMSLSSIINGELPDQVIDTNHPTAVIFATDLSFLIPAIIVSAVLLWKRKSWGYVLAPIVLTKSVTYSIVLIVMSINAYIEVGEGDPFLVLWIVLSVACIVSLAFLMGNMKSSQTIIK